MESEILYILRSGEKKTVKEVHRALGGNDNYNTVMTVMSRLEKKKQLAREKIGLQYEYWIADSSTSDSFLEKIKKKFFGGKTSVIVAQLIESADDLSDDDLDEMEKLLKKRRSSGK